MGGSPFYRSEVAFFTDRRSPFLQIGGRPFYRLGGRPFTDRGRLLVSLRGVGDAVALGADLALDDAAAGRRFEGRAARADLTLGSGFEDVLELGLGTARVIGGRRYGGGCRRDERDAGDQRDDFAARDTISHEECLRKM